MIYNHNVIYTTDAEAKVKLNIKKETEMVKDMIT